jgi:hypothetical protein
MNTIDNNRAIEIIQKYWPEHYAAAVLAASIEDSATDPGLAENAIRSMVPCPHHYESEFVVEAAPMVGVPSPLAAE